MTALFGTARGRGLPEPRSIIDTGAQAVERYKIDRSGTLRGWAKVCGLYNMGDLLTHIPERAKAANAKPTSIALVATNQKE